jgi:hypothetical protein
MGRVAINGVYIKNRSDGRKDRSLQPRRGLTARNAPRTR